MKLSFFLMFLLIFSAQANPRKRALERAKRAQQKLQSLTPEKSRSATLKQQRDNIQKVKEENFVGGLCEGAQELVNGRCLDICPMGTIRVGYDCVPGCPQGYELFDNLCLSSCQGGQLRMEDGTCSCEEDFIWDGSRCVDDKDYDEKQTQRCENGIWSGEKCLAKNITCRFGYEISMDGNSLICSCPKGSDYNIDKKSCVCRNYNQPPDDKGYCPVKYCDFNEVKTLKDKCECYPNSRKFVSTKDKRRFLCKPICEFNKNYLKSKDYCHCPKAANKLEEGDYYRCLRK
jgi:hypothetical protein